MDPTAPQSEASPPALDRDLYCLTCGYNLRGLSGDPVRCPECGDTFQMKVLDERSTARIITRRERIERQLESAAALCALPLSAGIIALVAAAADSRLGELLWPLFLGIAGAVLVAGLASFWWRAHRLAGWLPALLTYLLVAVPAFLIDLLLWGLVFWLWIVVPYWTNVVVGLVVVVVASVGLVRLKPTRRLRSRGARGLARLAAELDRIRGGGD